MKFKTESIISVYSICTRLFVTPSKKYMVDINTSNYLLALPKQVEQNIKMIDLSKPAIRLNLNIGKKILHGPFIFQIRNSLKGDYRISLHHQENDSYTGLNTCRL